MEEKRLKNRLVLVPRRWRLYWMGVSIALFVLGLGLGVAFSEFIVSAAASFIDFVTGYEIKIVPKD